MEDTLGWTAPSREVDAFSADCGQDHAVLVPDKALPNDAPFLAGDSAVDRHDFPGFTTEYRYNHYVRVAQGATTTEMGLINITKRTRVYFANKDPVKQALQAWRQGTYPGQHLWGAMALEAAGHEVVYSNFGGGQSALERFSSRWMRGRAGNLAQEAEALRSHAEVLFVADPRSLHLLAQRRYVPPIVAIVHPTVPSPENRLTYKAVGRYREVLCHSQHVYEEVLSIPGRSVSNTSLLPWGPDLLFPGYATMRGWRLRRRRWKDRPGLPRLAPGNSKREHSFAGARRTAATVRRASA